MREQKQTVSIGERIAEKLYKQSFIVYNDDISKAAALIDQELLAASQRNTDGVEQKTLGSETPTAPGLPRRRQANLWVLDDHDKAIVKRDVEVIGIAVDASNAERFVVAHNIENAKVYVALTKRAEYWRTNQSDPHGIATAVYVALMEVAGCLSPRWKDSNVSKRKQ